MPASIEAPTLLTSVATRTPNTFRAQTTTVAPMLNSCTCPRLGSDQISGAKTLPRAAAVAAVPARNEISATQPVNQPKCGPARRLDHW